MSCLMSSFTGFTYCVQVGNGVYHGRIHRISTIEQGANMIMALSGVHFHTNWVDNRYVFQIRIIQQGGNVVHHVPWVYLTHFHRRKGCKSGYRHLMVVNSALTPVSTGVNESKTPILKEIYPRGGVASVYVYTVYKNSVFRRFTP